MTTDRERIIAKLRDLEWGAIYAHESDRGTLDEKEIAIIIATLQAAEAAERQEPVAWCCEWNNGEKTVATFKSGWWQVGWTTGPGGMEIIAIYPLYAKPAGAADEKTIFGANMSEPPPA